MKNKKLISTVGLVFVLAMVFLLTTQGTIHAGDCRIVRINSTVTYQTVTLEPKNIVVDKGTCVIWFNKAAKANVEIVFEEGKKVCEDVVEASMDFKFDKDDCLITKTHIPRFGTASLMFRKEGSFDYVTTIKGTATKVKGQITVK